MNEIWRDVPFEGFSKLYQVSNMGNVRRVSSTICQYHPKAKSVIPVKYKERNLKKSKQSCGYLKVSLKSQYERLEVYVHRLVALVFLDKIDDSLNVVNHKNCIKHDNRLENLEWCNHKMNSEHAIKNGLMRRGKNHFASKPIYQLTMDGVILKEWESANSASVETGCNNKNIQATLKGKRNSCGGFKWVFKNL